MQDVQVVLLSLYPTPQAMIPAPPFHFAICNALKSTQVLYPDELALIKNTSDKRQNDFCAGRYCAHRIVKELGFAEYPLLNDANGAPIWPKTIVGSISHSGNMAVAVAATTQQIRSVGVDIQEYKQPFPSRVLRSVFSSKEIYAILKVQTSLMDIYAYSVFSAKESVFKCCYSAFGRLLNFTDISININFEEGSFYAYTSADMGENKLNKLAFKGRISFDNLYVTSIVWLETGQK